MTPLQRQVDKLVDGFLQQAADWRSLTAMTAGEMAYRMGRMGAMAAGSGRLLSAGVGLGVEVSVFEMANRGLTKGEFPNLWRWEGQGGIRQGLLSSLITFASLKGAGRLAQGENVVVRHLLQDTGMVLGHQISGVFGMTPRPMGSLVEQFLHAEATNLQLGAGMALGHGLTAGRLQAMERDLDFDLHSFLFTGSRPFLFAMAGSPVRRHFSDSFLMSRYKPGANVSQKRPIQEGSPSRQKTKDRDEEWGKEFRHVAAEESKQGHREQVLSVLKDLERELRIIYGHRVLGRGKMAEAEEMTRVLKEQLVAGEEKFKVIFPRLLFQLDSLLFLFTLDPLAKPEGLEPYRPWIEFFLPRRDALFRILKDINVQLEGRDLNELRSRIYLLHQLSAYLEKRPPTMAAAAPPSLKDEVLPHRVEGMLQARPPSKVELSRVSGNTNFTWVEAGLPRMVAKVQGRFSELMISFDRAQPPLDPNLRVVTELGGWWLCQALTEMGEPKSWAEEFLTTKKDGPAHEAMSEVMVGISQGSLATLQKERWAHQGALGLVKHGLYHFLLHSFDREQGIQGAMEVGFSHRTDFPAFTRVLLGAFHGSGFFSSKGRRGP